VTDDAVTTAAPGGAPPLRARLTLVLSPMGVALALCLVLVVICLARLSDSRRAVVDRIDPAALAARDLRAAMVDQETGVRGYALARDTAFLDPYERGRAAEGDSIARLHGLLDDEPHLVAAVNDAEGATARWRRETAEPTVAGVARGEPGVATGGFQEAGRARFDGVRSVLDRLDTALGAERRERADALFATAGQVGWAVAALALAIVATGAVLTISLRRSVTGPLERLSGEVRLVAAGQLDRRVAAAGSAELVGLAADIDAMRVRILDELAHLREASAAIAHQAEELARSNADLEQFAYVASHDLQEPLRKVAGFCQLLQRRYGGQLDERADEYIHYAVDGAQRMQQLINDLLAFSRVGRTTERFVSVALGDAAQRALDNLATAVDRAGATVEIGQLPPVKGDPRLLTALLQNLIGNGIKFHRSQTPARVEVRAETEADGSAVTVSVTDDGIGVEPPYRDQIFTLFKRLHTRAEYEGTGIGLAVCKRIVEFHGGRIWLEPNDGDGSVFRFTLPLDEERLHA
jgi:signal transduction histidine kinase